MGLPLFEGVDGRLPDMPGSVEVGLADAEGNDVPHLGHDFEEVPDAGRFGVADLKGASIASIEEKPAHPKSPYAVIGIYLYDGTVFEKVKNLVPSKRGELEITDVNNAYIREGTMTFSFLEGWWTDAGTFESLLRAANMVAQSRLKKASG